MKQQIAKKSCTNPMCQFLKHPMPNHQFLKAHFIIKNSNRDHKTIRISNLHNKKTSKFNLDHENLNVLISL
jgi:hypothetical protein